MSDPPGVEKLSEGDHFAVAALPGYEQPVIVLDARFVSDLSYAWRAARTRALTIHPGQEVDAILQLCELLKPLLKRYEQACVEYAARRPLPKEAAEIMKELEELRDLLNR